MFNILTRGHHPYDGHTINETQRKIWNGEPDLSAVSDPVAMDMLKKMLPVNRNERSSAASLLVSDKLSICESLLCRQTALKRVINTGKVPFKHIFDHFPWLI